MGSSTDDDDDAETLRFLALIESHKAHKKEKGIVNNKKWEAVRNDLLVLSYPTWNSLTAKQLADQYARYCADIAAQYPYRVRPYLPSDFPSKCTQAAYDLLLEDTIVGHRRFVCAITGDLFQEDKGDSKSVNTSSTARRTKSLCEEKMPEPLPSRAAAAINEEEEEDRRLLILVLSAVRRHKAHLLNTTRAWKAVVDDLSPEFPSGDLPSVDQVVKYFDQYRLSVMSNLQSRSRTRSAVVAEEEQLMRDIIEEQDEHESTTLLTDLLSAHGDGDERPVDAGFERTSDINDSSSSDEVDEDEDEDEEDPEDARMSLRKRNDKEVKPWLKAMRKRKPRAQGAIKTRSRGSQVKITWSEDVYCQFFHLIAQTEAHLTGNSANGSTKGDKWNAVRDGLVAYLPNNTSVPNWTTLHTKYCQYCKDTANKHLAKGGSLYDPTALTADERLCFRLLHVDTLKKNYFSSRKVRELTAIEMLSHPSNQPRVVQTVALARKNSSTRHASKPEEEEEAAEEEEERDDEEEKYDSKKRRAEKCALVSSQGSSFSSFSAAGGGTADTHRANRANSQSDDEVDDSGLDDTVQPLRMHSSSAPVRKHNAAADHVSKKRSVVRRLSDSSDAACEARREKKKHKRVLAEGAARLKIIQAEKERELAVEAAKLKTTQAEIELADKKIACMQLKYDLKMASQQSKTSGGRK